ncbi:MAG: Ig-like domain-containing protein [Clostridiales Family XIII bacterium]|jgi:uncharacterized protein YjdB|nr:Ig-like domain-containing protein [Clostridiales Family XIII bacterium]
MKRILSIVLSLTLIVGLFGMPMAVHAASSGGISVTLTATGGEPELGTSDSTGDYWYNDHAFYVNSDTPLTISGNTTTVRIIVGSGFTADITLDGASITNVDSPAIQLNSGAIANLHLKGTNTLQSNKSAGIQTTDAEITIDGTGQLSVTGGDFSAGIGGSPSVDGTNGQNSGRGISGGIGGDGGNGGVVIINSGEITATGGTDSVGIGGSNGGNGGNSGNSTNSGVSGTSGGDAGNGGNGSIVSINGGAIVVIGGIGGGTGGNGGNGGNGGGTSGGLGYSGGYGGKGGDSGNGGTITINGGTVTVVDGIGGGSIGLGGLGGLGSGGSSRARSGADGSLSGSGEISIFGGSVTVLGEIGVGSDGFNLNNKFSIDGNAVVRVQSFSVDLFQTLPQGVVFVNGEGSVYGNVTLPCDLTVGDAETLAIPNNRSLTIPNGTTLTNNGSISIIGTTTNDGVLTNNGTIKNGGTLTNNASGIINNAGSIDSTEGTIDNKGTLTGTTVVGFVSKVTIANATTIHKYKAVGANTMLHTVNVEPENAKNKTVTWSSADKSIATVDATSGLVTFKGKEGTVRITATANDGSKISHYKDIKVVKNVTKIRTPLSTVNITKGKTLTLPVALDDGSKTITGAKTTFTSSNKKIVTVDSKGKIKGIKAGKAKINITTANGKKLAVNIVVGKKAVKLAKFTLSGTPKNNVLAKGKTAQLKINLAQKGASDLKVSYTSSKKTVLTVDNAGKITSVGKGKATITVKVGTKSIKTKSITVK